MILSSAKPFFPLILILILLLVASNSVMAGPSAYSKSLGEWIEEPTDSIQEDQRRIWLANESGRTLRIRIDIFDRSNRVVRHFVEANIGPGYVNIYWDKKDDSGLWVSPGEYQYRIDLQGKEKTGKLIASFDPSELLVQIYPEAKDSPGLIRYDILGDSVLVTAGVYLLGGKRISVSIVDSLHLKGSYQFKWNNPGDTHKAAYRFKLKAAGVTHKTKISRVVNEKK